jgi:hypothetical protein
MADKPVLSVNVDDSKLQELIEKYQKFSESAKSSPIEIKAGNAAKETGQTISKFEQLTTNFDKLVKHLEDPKLSARNTGLIDRMGIRSKEIGIAFRGIERSIQVVERSFSNILRGGVGLTAFGGGILGAVTGFGVSLLGGSILSTKELAGQVRQANALGLQPGEGKAFKDVYGSHIEGADEAMLAKVANIKGNRQLWGSLLSLGIGQNQIEHQDTAHLSAEILQRAGQKYKQLGAGYGQFAAHTGLDSVVDVNQARAAANPQLDWGAMAHDFEKVSAQLALTEAEQKKALDMQQRFDAAMDRIKQKLETVFLDKLAPWFEKFADQVADFVGSGQFEEIVVEASHVVENFIKLGKQAVALIEDLAGSPELADDIKMLSHAFEQLTHGIEELWEKIKPLLAKNEAQSAQLGSGLMDMWDAAKKGDWKKVKEIATRPLPEPSTDAFINDRWGKNIGTAKDFIPDKNKAEDFRAFEQKYGLRAGTLNVSEMIESSGGKGGMVSSQGAVGGFQFMKDTGIRYGLSSTDRWNEKKSAEAAAHLLSDDLKRYHGDYNKAFAAYNAGEKTVDWAVSQGEKYHRDWRYYLPDETENYVRKAAQYSQGLKGEEAVYTGKVQPQQNMGNNYGQMAPVKFEVNVHAPPGYDSTVSVGGLPR